MGTYGTDIQAALIKQIKAEMAALDWKQPELAQKAGIPKASLHRYLSGDRDLPLPAFLNIANALGLSLGELTERAQRRLDGKDVL
ncbi:MULTISPECIES: helix-turn-helix domain-containing protein [Arthrobacter]|uniref:XRE family transcriptional regulator n=1 Tax=Arthrobacter terricola TaxID=2547396 RepID=A0A4R5KPN9_9MICC|nr:MULTISPECIES: helix-turn-helix transcriptional regulator [Arthrobacter]MBT8161049.1 helix-turn-helix domain-containing protein [Arthrobacter sp. GN70]TDF96908.1 XRE family transcriptional regulator [Arthrobacter terricola]